MTERPAGALPRRLGVSLAIVPVLAVGLADAVIAARSASAQHVHATHHVTAPARPATSAVARDDARAAIGALLDRRASALQRRDASTFLATVDPLQPAFVAQQRRVFAAMTAVPFAEISYTIGSGATLPANARTRRYGAPTWAPSHLALHYEIRGFDAAPTTLQQYPTFVHRREGWFVASFGDFTTAGQRPDLDIWDFGSVTSSRAPGVLVLGHPSSRSLLHDVAVEASAAIPLVSKVWRRPWSRRVVILVPSTQHELARLVDDKGDLRQIAAVASAEVQDCPGPPEPVGNRVAINPANWSKLSPLGQRVVLTHELTHVATRSDTGSCTPTWLVEGFADYVGYLTSGVPVTVVAEELAADVRAGRVPRRLPPDADFDGSSKRLAQAYEGAWLACRLIVARWGQATLVRFYRAVGSAQDPQEATRSALRSVLHLTPASFVALWRDYLRAQLS